MFPAQWIVFLVNFVADNEVHTCHDHEAKISTAPLGVEAGNVLASKPCFISGHLAQGRYRFESLEIWVNFGDIDPYFNPPF